VPSAFVDSGAWIAILDRREPLHVRAVDFYRSLGRTRIFTSNYVVSETLSWLAQKNRQALSPRFRKTVLDGRRIRWLTLLWIDEETHTDAWDLYDQFSARAFSFTDCTSFVLAKREKVDFVFGFDADFRTMGLDLRPGP